MMNLIFVLLMQPQENQNPLVSFLPLLLIILVFYLFMIRPQMKRQKELREYRSQLKKGDRIITTGGIYGKVNDISDNIVTIEVEDQVKIKVDKSAILKDPTDLSAQQRR